MITLASLILLRQYSPDEIAIILSRVTKTATGSAVFYTGYLKNVLENSVTSFMC